MPPTTAPPTMPTSCLLGLLLHPLSAAPMMTNIISSVTTPIFLVFIVFPLSRRHFFATPRCPYRQAPCQEKHSNKNNAIGKNTKTTLHRPVARWRQGHAGWFQVNDLQGVFLSPRGDRQPLERQAALT